jgi:hypothetical protein
MWVFPCLPRVRVVAGGCALGGSSGVCMGGAGSSRFACHSWACPAVWGLWLSAWVGWGWLFFIFSFFFLPLGPLCGGFAIPSVGLALPPDGLPHCFVSVRPPLLLLTGILHGLAAPSMAPSWPLRALPFRSPLQPLGLAALPHSLVKRSPCPPRRARGPRPPPGALPCVSPGGVRGPLSGSGRPAPPWVVGGSPAGPVGHAALPPCCAAPLAAIVTSSGFRGGAWALCVRTFRPCRLCCILF